MKMKKKDKKKSNGKTQKGVEVTVSNAKTQTEIEHHSSKRQNEMKLVSEIDATKQHKCELPIEQLSNIFNKVDFHFLITNSLNPTHSRNNQDNTNDSRSNGRNLLYPRDIGNLIMWSVPTPIPLIESPHKFFIKNKSKLRHVLLIYVNNKVEQKDNTSTVSNESIERHIYSDNTNENDNNNNNFVHSENIVAESNVYENSKEINKTKPETENKSCTDTEEKTTTTTTKTTKPCKNRHTFDCNPFVKQNIPHVALLSYPSSSSSPSLSLPSSPDVFVPTTIDTCKRTNRFIQELFWRSSKPKTIVDYNNNNSTKNNSRKSNDDNVDYKETTSNRNNNNCNTSNNNTKTVQDTNTPHDLGIGVYQHFKRAREIHKSMSSPLTTQQATTTTTETTETTETTNDESEKSEVINYNIQPANKSNLPNFCEGKTMNNINASIVKTSNAQTNNLKSASVKEKEHNNFHDSEGNTKQENTVDAEQNKNVQESEESEVQRQWRSIWSDVSLLKSYALHWPEHEHELLSLGYTLSENENEHDFICTSTSQQQQQQQQEEEQYKKEENKTQKWMCISSTCAPYDDINNHNNDKFDNSNNNNNNNNNNGIINNDDDENKKSDNTERIGVFALDCEMVLTTNYVSSLARVTLIDVIHETILLDELVKPNNTIINYLTRYSGITSDDLINVTTSLSDIQTRLLELFQMYKECFIVGHSLENDFKALYWLPRQVYILDTAFLYPHHCQLPLKNSLKWLAVKYLHTHIQHSSHDSAEDALVSAKLAFLKLQNGPSFGISNVHKYSILQLIKEGLTSNNSVNTTSNNTNSCTNNPKNSHVTTHESYSDRDNNNNNNCKKVNLNVVIKLFDDATILQHILPSECTRSSALSSSVLEKVNTLESNTTIERAGNNVNDTSGKFVIDCIATHNNEDATRKCIRALKQLDKAHLSSSQQSESSTSDTYQLMWVQLSEENNEHHHEEEQEQKIQEREKEEEQVNVQTNEKVKEHRTINEQVAQIIDATPEQTLILLLVSAYKCGSNCNANNEQNELQAVQNSNENNLTNCPAPYLRTQGACFGFVKDELFCIDDYIKTSNNNNNNINNNNINNNILSTKHTSDATFANHNKNKNEKEDVTSLQMPSGCEHQEEEEEEEEEEEYEEYTELTDQNFL